ncbi:hypothetical protein HMPREF3185_00218 [Porphyromonas somerae]|uniref:Uncharacterized protein n=1 Tax=Porphyromonas somerae TaxID=322095 RepID=A0A134BEB3_9PORP|nr:hypothetical protein HMPREF3184_00218 [Porphyromonadaceae bacterium KA00676]KXB78249.1 hypothetical protein HMPREF3185_00218 [Porphyromonas somerae]
MHTSLRCVRISRCVHRTKAKKKGSRSAHYGSPLRGRSVA